MSEAKPFEIPKRLVWDAYRQVRANRGAGGVDGVSMAAFEEDLGGNLYKVWNRMSSGSYHPPPVRLVEIPKSGGGLRPLGIPTIADRVAQTAVKMVLEPMVEPMFHRDSYGYRPGRSALDAVGVARKRCWTFDWVIDLDIKAFFDSIPHDLIERAVAHHTDLAWIRLYVGRWLRAAVERPDGTREERTKGTPQGSPISPILANLFLHYAFDSWMERNHPNVRFERYADDAVVHCRSEGEAQAVLEAIRKRLADCGLELHPTKTKIVYCKDDDRRQEHERVKFDFLGFTFQPRRARNRWGHYFVSFLPAISVQAAKAVRRTIREWRMASTRNNQTLEDLARLINPAVRGWMNYYGRYYRSKCVQVLRQVNVALARWARRKYKRFRRRERASTHWLGRIARRDPNLFVLWQLGIRPEAGE
ncbi:group II intron reverse transcriptase/maturase [Hoeflea sp.]|uniref:group II intron reverse transcriptase/maturase n=1 Tax=Hoeflea sp. TaxID=1940281 RepID=UPI003B02DA44